MVVVVVVAVWRQQIKTSLTLSRSPALFNQFKEAESLWLHDLWPVCFSLKIEQSKETNEDELFGALIIWNFKKKTTSNKTKQNAHTKKFRSKKKFAIKLICFDFYVECQWTT